jgi:outer membrane protein assembly factor BamB
MSMTRPFLSAWLGGFILFFGLVHRSDAADGMLYPLAAAVAENGTIFVADRDLPGIWKYTDGKWSIYFQGSKKFRTPLNAVRCLAIDQQGKLLAGDSSTREIYRFDDSNQPQPLTKGGVGIPMSLAVAKDGSIYAGDIEIQRIVKIPAEGGTPEIIAEVTAPRGMTFDVEGRLWVVSHGKDAVIRLSTDGKQREVIIEGRPFQFQHHIVLGTQGEAFVADGYAKTIWKIKQGEKPEAFIAGEPLKNPVGLAWWKGELLIVDPHAKAAFRSTADGKLEPIISSQ